MTSCRPVLTLLLALLMPLGRTAPAQSSSSDVIAPRPRLTAYFLQGGLFTTPQYTVKTLADSGGAALLDQLNYSQGFASGGHCSIADPNADLNYTFTAAQSLDGKADLPTQPFRGNFHQLKELKRRYPRMKVLISLEGRASDFAEDARPSNRQAFVRSCVDLFLKGQFAPGVAVPSLFDGIDVDWEYPHKENAANFVALLAEFRQQMNAFRPGLLLTIAVGGAQAYEGADLREVSTLVDEIGLMTYDFAGPWSRVTGFNAPLRSDPFHRIGNAEDFARAWRAAGVPDNKLLLGLPFYGYGWRRVEEANNGLFQEGEPIRGDHSFRDIQTIAQDSVVYRDDASQAPWLFDGDIFWTYEDPVSIHRKADFVREQGLGGLMIWQLGDDNADALLLHAAHNGLLVRAVQQARLAASPNKSTP